jgi:hypothetical protein
MKVSKKQLKSIIREERSRLLAEQGGFGPDNMAMVLIEFAKAWSSMGAAVQEQVTAIVAAGSEIADPTPQESPEFEDVVYQQNPNAIDVALRQLENKGENIEGMDELMEYLWAAQDIMKGEG